eukprot:1208174-Pleurochrysis_carterae.AAC.1
MQQPSATIANLDGPRTDDRRAPPQKGQTSQPHRPAWWTPGGGEGMDRLQEETAAVACRLARVEIAAMTA